MRLFNVPSYLHAAGVTVDCPGLGEIAVDIAYGGNYYAIVEPQANYADLADFSAGDLHPVAVSNHHRSRTRKIAQRLQYPLAAGLLDDRDHDGERCKGKQQYRFHAIAQQ